MAKKTVSPAVSLPDKPHCGLVMPISAIDGCTEQHWADVKSILTEALDSAGFTATIVSEADDVGVIQKRIIQNLYENPVVVCDVSGKNPNVMFELGMRLAFDKPAIIVKDDKTAISFDTSPIEHLEYPRDLRFNRIVAFKKSLAEKVKATHDKATNDPAYTTFLKHFGSFSVATLETKEVSKEDYIIELLEDFYGQLAQMRTPFFSVAGTPIIANTGYPSAGSGGFVNFGGATGVLFSNRVQSPQMVGQSVQIADPIQVSGFAASPPQLPPDGKP